VANDKDEEMKVDNDLPRPSNEPMRTSSDFGCQVCIADRYDLFLANQPSGFQPSALGGAVQEDDPINDQSLQAESTDASAVPMQRPGLPSRFLQQFPALHGSPYVMMERYYFVPKINRNESPRAQPPRPGSDASGNGQQQ